MPEHPNVISILDLLKKFKDYKVISTRDKYKKYIRLNMIPVFEKYRFVIFNFTDINDSDVDLYQLLSDTLFTLCIGHSVSAVEKKLVVENGNKNIIDNIEGFYKFMRTEYKIK